MPSGWAGNRAGCPVVGAGSASSPTVRTPAPGPARFRTSLTGAPSAPVPQPEAGWEHFSAICAGQRLGNVQSGRCSKHCCRPILRGGSMAEPPHPKRRETAPMRSLLKLRAVLLAVLVLITGVLAEGAAAQTRSGETGHRAGTRHTGHRAHRGRRRAGHRTRRHTGHRPRRHAGHRTRRHTGHRPRRHAGHRTRRHTGHRAHRGRRVAGHRTRRHAGHRTRRHRGHRTRRPAC